MPLAALSRADGGAPRFRVDDLGVYGAKAKRRTGVGGLSRDAMAIAIDAITPADAAA